MHYVFHVGRRTGFLKFALPRIYLGLHYPTDILAGAAIGVLISPLCNVLLAKTARLHAIASWSYTKPQLFFRCFPASLIKLPICSAIAGLFSATDSA